MLFLLLVVAADDAGQAARAEAARTMVKRLAAEEFEQAREGFDETMERLLPAARLETVWKSTVRIYGELKSFGEPRHEKKGEYRAVIVPCLLDKGKVDARVVFDAKGKVAGFFIKPASDYRRPKYVDADRFAFPGHNGRPLRLRFEPIGQSRIIGA